MKSFSVASVGLLLAATVLSAIGCSGSGSVQEVVFDVELHIDGHPVPDVQVALAPMDAPNAVPVLTGITDHSGIAGMMMVDGQVPSSDVTEYRVIVESLGDWRLAAPWSDPEKSPLAISWPSSEQTHLIELPKKAVRRL
ncbi:MAG: hypothetical protein Aurels2KO_37800 [Aureliella sp.]